MKCNESCAFIANGRSSPYGAMGLGGRRLDNSLVFVGKAFLTVPEGSLSGSSCAAGQGSGAHWHRAVLAPALGTAVCCCGAGLGSRRAAGAARTGQTPAAFHALATPRHGRTGPAGPATLRWARALPTAPPNLAASRTQRSSTERSAAAPLGAALSHRACSQRLSCR